MYSLVPSTLCDISSVGSQNLVTLIFTKTTFVNEGIPSAWSTFCLILEALDQLELPKKASIMLQIIVSMKISIIAVLILPRCEVLP